VLKQFGEALADDLNFSKALAVVLPWANSKPEDPAVALAALNKINDVLAVAPLGEEAAEAQPSEGDLDILSLCKALDEARASKDWPTADGIRSQIQAAGYDVKTTPEGTVAERQLA
jgi:cysteinyl-tRNA synthetase